MLLSVDSSSVTAACGLLQDDVVIKSEFVNSGLTHSETLLPMIKRVISSHKIDDIDEIAVTVGPGSFTGVRIGVATVKGIAYKNNIPCKAVSSLQAVAHNFESVECVVCVVMDARRMQFYNAVFSVNNGKVKRITNDDALPLEKVEELLLDYNQVIIAGDGAKLFCQNSSLKNIVLCNEEQMYVTGQGVALASKQIKSIKPSALIPVYLRLSQAERELKLKRSKQ